MKSSTEEMEQIKSSKKELETENKNLKEFLDPKKILAISRSADNNELINVNNSIINNINNDNIIKEKDEKINNLNKTIDSLTNENRNLKLKA